MLRAAARCRARCCYSLTQCRTLVATAAETAERRQPVTEQLERVEFEHLESLRGPAETFCFLIDSLVALINVCD